jgi:hypothetical protein
LTSVSGGKTRRRGKEGLTAQEEGEEETNIVLEAKTTKHFAAGMNKLERFFSLPVTSTHV